MKKGFVLGGGSYLSEGKQLFVLALIDLDAQSPSAETIPLSFMGHGFAFDPTCRFRVALFEKKGPGAAVVDLRERRVVRPIETPPNRRFYGHGAYSQDGALLYATESVVSDGFAGILSVRDAVHLGERRQQRAGLPGLWERRQAKALRKVAAALLGLDSCQAKVRDPRTAIFPDENIIWLTRARGRTRRKRLPGWT